MDRTSNDFMILNKGDGDDDDVVTETPAGNG